MITAVSLMTACRQVRTNENGSPVATPASTTSVVIISGWVRQAPIGVVDRHIDIRLTRCFCIEIYGQIAIYQGGMSGNVFNIVATHGIYCIDAKLRFM